MRLAEYEVWVSSDGKRLSEYDVEGTSEGDKICCYIESKVGQVRVPMLIIHNILVVCVVRRDSNHLARHYLFTGRIITVLELCRAKLWCLLMA